MKMANKEKIKRSEDVSYAISMIDTLHAHLIDMTGYPDLVDRTIKVMNDLEFFKKDLK